eukprot:CAMPEP_0195518512 /NCGR_PEP_ID=MMETSP0794_2-20130614/13039_1 /TAXON_ID=515487 /ORGANISM="Stephanopyxis turris, Strain CCMP 815" /LENGTH=195 /DNA_ID=CAMNT_0040647489 /DNA_START=103 /DNA_END=690 /DNA_ORIENTATION=-
MVTMHHFFRSSLNGLLILLAFFPYIAVALKTKTNLRFTIEEHNESRHKPSLELEGDPRAASPLLKRISSKKVTKHIQTTMCEGKCEKGCVTYITPLGECYSPSQMFPGDPSWGDYDILDEILGFTVENNNSGVNFRRSFYTTTDSTCEGVSVEKKEPTDMFILPLNECVGPFGEPRPWGTFQIKEGEDLHDLDQI